MESAFRAPDPFNFNGQDVAQRWAKWRKTFETYFTAAEVEKKPAKVQIAILLHAAGEEAQEIHSQFTFGDEENKEDITTVLKKFDTYCKPRKNTVFERYRFWSKEHTEGEPIDKWVKDLKTISANCEYKDEEDQLRDKIVFAYKDNKVKERMLRESKLDLPKALEICRAAESTKDQIKSMCGESLAIQALRNSRDQSRESSRDRNYSRERSGTDNQFRCFNCNDTGHMSRDCPEGDSFPAPRGRSSSRGGRSRSRSNSRGGRGRGRSTSNQINRFDNRESRTFYDMEEAHDPLAEFQTLSLSAVSINSINKKTTVTKRFAPFEFYNEKAKLVDKKELKVDSGSEGNLMPLQTYAALYPERMGEDGLPLPEFVKKSDATLTAYGGSVIRQLGWVTLPCSFKDRKFMADFYLSNAQGPMLLGLPLGEKLGIIKIDVNNVECQRSNTIINKSNQVSVIKAAPSNPARSQQNTVTSYVSRDVPLELRQTIRTKEDLKIMYPECFTEGPQNHFPDYEYHITIEPGVKGKIHPPRRQPLELQEPIKKELDRMVARGAITKVNEPTDWVSSMHVTTRANGKLRICLDASELNKVIKREHYAAAVVQDKTHLLNGSDTFTKLDLKDGYWHVRLDEESSYLTTFNTPFGRYRYLVMPNGLNVSQDIFQMKIDETYHECTGVVGIADDINVHSAGDTQHNYRLHEAMERTRRSRLSLNYEKIELKKPSIKFFGNIYTKDGVKPDPDKVDAINHLRPPETKSELKTFLGMVNYLQQFIPNLSQHTAPLREIEKKGVDFYWDVNLQNCFENIKELVAADVTLSYYDRSKPVKIQTDWSKQGIGAVLLQDGRPVHYGSKALVGNEQDFATIEGEMLAIVYATTKWHHYLYGRRFLVETDHKPLVDIKNKNIALAPPRVRSMLMMTRQYDFELRHRKGEEMVLPDTLSRLSTAEKFQIPGLEIGVHSIVEITDARLKQLVEDTANDSVLQRLLSVFQKGWPTSIKGLHKDLRPFWSIRDDISFLDGLLMCGSRIIIPEVARKRTLDTIHEGHQGEVKCTLKAKTAVYWPGMYKEIAEMVQKCESCQEHANAQPKCPMIAMEVPPHPWHTLGADHFKFKGKWYLIISDYFSKMPFIRPVNSTSAPAAIAAVKGIISENGIPYKVISDNNPFNSYEFNEFAKSYGFQVTSSSPEYPRGHGLIERHVQTVKKCMYKCDHSGQDIELALLSLRSTPLDSNLPSPAELLNGRKYRTTMPSVNHSSSAATNSDIRNQLESRQQTSKGYYDQHTREKSELLANQSVWVRNNETRRWEPAYVIKKADTPRSYIVQRCAGGVPLRRNRQHIRPASEQWNAEDMENGT